MRLFIALNLPGELKARLAAEVLGPLRARLPGVRWVREETLHVTLLFLGERGDAEADEARAVVREVAASHEPFTASLAGLGMFPNPTRPRVIWLGLSAAASVLALHRALRLEHARLGAPFEGRAFSPHVTLGRVPPSAEASTREALPAALAAVRFSAPVAFGSVELMRSEPTPRGPRYTALLSAPLGHGER